MQTLCIRCLIELNGLLQGLKDVYKRQVYWERKEEYIRVEVTLEKEERICLILNGEEEIVKVQGSLEREVRVK